MSIPWIVAPTRSPQPPSPTRPRAGPASTTHRRRRRSSVAGLKDAYPSHRDPLSSCAAATWATSATTALARPPSATASTHAHPPSTLRLSDRSVEGRARRAPTVRRPPPARTRPLGLRYRPHQTTPMSPRQRLNVTRRGRQQSKQRTLPPVNGQDRQIPHGQDVFRCRRRPRRTSVTAGRTLEKPNIPGAPRTASLTERLLSSRKSL